MTRPHHTPETPIWISDLTPPPVSLQAMRSCATLLAISS